MVMKSACKFEYTSCIDNKNNLSNLVYRNAQISPLKIWMRDTSCKFVKFHKHGLYSERIKIQYFFFKKIFNSYVYVSADNATMKIQKEI